MSNQEEQLQRLFTCEQPGRAAKASMITCEQKMSNKEEHLRTNSLGEKSFVCTDTAVDDDPEDQNSKTLKSHGLLRVENVHPRSRDWTSLNHFHHPVCFKLLQIGILMVILLAHSFIHPSV